MNPLPIREQEQRSPSDRPQNVKLSIDPAAVEGFDYYEGYSFAVGTQATELSVWGFPWWLADRPTGYGAEAYGAGPYGQAAGLGDYGALRYGRGDYGTGAGGTP